MSVLSSGWAKAGFSAVAPLTFGANSVLCPMPDLDLLCQGYKGLAASLTYIHWITLVLV